MKPKIIINYGPLQPTQSVWQFLDEQNYDLRRKKNLARRAKISMNQSINTSVGLGNTLPPTPSSDPKIYTSTFDVRNRQLILAAVIRFDHVADSMEVLLTGDLYIASLDESEPLINYLEREME